MSDPHVDVAVAEPAQLGESPVWSGAEQRLYWADIDGQAVHRFDPATGSDEIQGLPARPGSLALTAEPGQLLVAIEHELVRFDFESGSIEPFVVLEEPNVGIRLNDGRTDPGGRFVVGSMFADTKALKTVGSLHMVSADGSHQVLRTNVGTANGLAFDTARNRMYFADTPTQKVIVWDFDVDTGQRQNERVFFDYSTIDGKPDGACVDAEGYYWSASVYGWAVVRISPSGAVERRIELPVEKPTMPAFGGPELTTLFVTSIGGGSGARNGVAAGALLAINLASEGIAGVAEPVFGVG